ncbi:aldehyde dehydrogenase [Marmoricola endophyticus]|uniref:Aldehyde dehydrogenase n=1 Tax=Marmoricola endophyticus TaxID=2040280 RepID=A0A917BQX5_9ACTN|nr:aldehyde dehydrogenase family protein [Marmoricola endophyticus]GGF51182.1 aldehyde dehydrogenase [Marmoricola endophyticus]
MTAVIASYLPRTGEVHDEVKESSPRHVRAALARAGAAAPAVEAVPPAERATWLDALAQAVEAAATGLVEQADLETALGHDRLSGEVQRLAAQLRFYAEVAAGGESLEVTLDRATDTRPALARYRRPRGVVAVFAASNFPFAFGILGHDTASALASGCPVVIKAHSAHPVLGDLLADLLVDTLRECGAPAGAASVVSGFEAGLSLVGADEVAAVAFTGSTSGGTALLRAAAQRPVPVPVYAEMGSVNPVLVTPSAATTRMAEIARGFVASYTAGSGQMCTKPGLLLAPRGADAARLVTEAFRELAPQPVMLTSGIAADVGERMAAMESAGATVLASSGSRESGWSAPAAVLAAGPTALRRGSSVLEECFGAVAVVVEHDPDVDAAEGLAWILPELPGALAATVQTAGRHDPDAARYVDLLAGRAGRLVVDQWPPGVATTWSQHHGGPWPATADPAWTSVGATALDRFLVPVVYQNATDALLPPPLRSDNPWRLPRRVDGRPEEPA